MKSPILLGNRYLTRVINHSIILNTIKTVGPIDRAQVARLTGLSPATVTGITSDLIELGLVFEKAQGESRGGRPPIMLAINPQGGYVVGIKLMEDHALGALTDLEATVLAKDSISLADTSSTTAIATMAELVERLLAASDLPRQKLIGVGIGLAGIVNFETGVLRQSPFFGWRDLPLRDLLQVQIKVPVYIDNDVNTLTLAEQWFGVGQGVEDFLTLTVGRGIGLGIVANGRFYRGAGGGAGEFGHILVNPNGPVCTCGKTGCLESYVGYPGLLLAAQTAFEEGKIKEEVVSISDLVARAEAGEAAIQQILAQAGELIGRSVANLINIFDPQLIIIGGEGVRLGPWLFDAMQGALQRYASPYLLVDCVVRVEPWGDDAWARGAASLVLRHLFESPVHKNTAPFGVTS